MADLADQLRGERLALRRWTLEDVDVLLSAIQSSYDELHRWMSWADVPPTIDSIREVIEMSGRKFDDNARWEYGLYELATDECVGSAGLRSGDAPDELEIGYWVRTDRTGLGYASEAARVLTTAAFSAPLHIARVRISMDAANHASAKVPRKLGFHLQAEESRPSPSHGHSGVDALWTVTREQWRLRHDV